MSLVAVKPLLALLEPCLPWQHGGVATVASLTQRVETKGIFPASVSHQGKQNIVRRCIELANLHARQIMPLPDTIEIDPEGECVDPRHPRAVPIRDTILVPHPEWRSRR